MVSFIIDQEMTQFCGVEPAYTRKLKAMLLFLANNVPYDVSIAKLSSYLEINKNYSRTGPFFIFCLTQFIDYLLGLNGLTTSKLSFITQM
ncbi:MAG: hypothetical protein IJ552_06645 [Prevotella sp.]|nr:hypothetical protein [Prevotella sp.]